MEERAAAAALERLELARARSEAAEGIASDCLSMSVADAQLSGVIMSSAVSDSLGLRADAREEMLTAKAAALERIELVCVRAEAAEKVIPDSSDTSGANAPVSDIIR